jgi:DNA-binding NarL/FixJ family response regulator
MQGTISESRAEAAPIQVLIVDDHAMFAESLQRALEGEADIHIMAVSYTAADAIAVVDREKPDVVLMDYELPDAPGTDAAAIIKRRHPESQVVMLTGFVNDDILLGAIEAGCSGYVTKDEAVRDVVSAIRAAAAGEALISAALLARLLPRIRRRAAERIGAPDLTPRELEVLRLLAAGVSNQEIADRLFVTLKTARNHVQNTITKLGAHSKLEAVTLAVRLGIIEFPKE